MQFCRHAGRACCNRSRASSDGKTSPLAEPISTQVSHYSLRARSSQREAAVWCICDPKDQQSPRAFPQATACGGNRRFTCRRHGCISVRAEGPAGLFLRLTRKRIARSGTAEPSSTHVSHASLRARSSQREAAEGCISVPTKSAGNLDRKIAPQVAQRKEALDSSPRRLAMCKLRCDMAIQHSREMQPSTEPNSPKPIS